VLDHFHAANKALSGTFGNRPMGWVRAEHEPPPIADVDKSAGDSSREISLTFGCIQTTMIGDRTEAAQVSPMA